MGRMGKGLTKNSKSSPCGIVICSFGRFVLHKKQGRSLIAFAETFADADEIL